MKQEAVQIELKDSIELKDNRAEEGKAHMNNQERDQDQLIQVKMVSKNEDRTSPAPKKRGLGAKRIFRP